MNFLLGLLSPRVLIGLAIAVAVAFAAGWLRHSGFKAGASSVQAKWDKRERQLIEAHDAALADEIADHNQKVSALESNHAQTKRLRDAFAVDASVAESAASASAFESRRLRDAIATSDLATRREVDAAGAAGKCDAAIAASDLRGRMLERLDAATGELEDAARGIGRHADEAWAAASECAGAYSIARSRAASAP